MKLLQKLVVVASASGAAGLNIVPGTAPAAPSNGDTWTTSSGLFTQVNGSTKTVAFLEGAAFTGPISTTRSDGLDFAEIVSHTGGTVSRHGLKITTSGTSTTTDALRVDTGAITGALVVSGGGITTIAGQLQSTLANNTATGGGQIYLNGATGNRIDFNSNGAAPPSLTTRSVGTKLVLSPTLSGTLVDYAIGVDTNTMWFSAPDTVRNYKWYGGTSATMTLTSAGALTLTSTIQASNFSSGASVSGTNTGDQTVAELEEDFNYPDVATLQNKWSISAPANVSIVTTTDSGGSAIQIGDNSGNDQVTGVMLQGLAYIPSEEYELIWDIEIIAAGASTVLYLGVQGLDAAGNNLGSSYNYVAASGLNESTHLGRQTLRAYMKGTAAVAAGSTGSTVDAPTALPDGSKFAFGQGGVVTIKPMFLANYSAQPGQIIIHSVSLRKIRDWAMSITNKPAVVESLAGTTWTSGTQVLTLTAANTVTLKPVGSATGNLLDRASGDSLYAPLVGPAFTNGGTFDLTGGFGFSVKTNSTLGSVGINAPSANVVQLNVRPEPTKTGIVSYTHNAVADRWSVGIKPSDGNLYWSAGDLLLGNVKLTLTSAGNLTAVGTITASNFSGSSTGTNTGDQTITLTGDVTGTGTGSFVTAIGANKVTRPMLAPTAGATLLGATAAGNVSDLTAAQAKTFLAIAVSDVSGAAPLASPTFTGTVNLPATTISAPLPLTLNSTTSNSNKIILQDNGTAITFFGGGATMPFQIQQAAVPNTVWFSINPSGNATFSGTVGASNISGTNTGDETGTTILSKLSTASGTLVFPGNADFRRADTTASTLSLGSSVGGTSAEIDFYGAGGVNIGRIKNFYDGTGVVTQTFSGWSGGGLRDIATLDAVNGLTMLRGGVTSTGTISVSGSGAISIINATLGQDARLDLRQNGTQVGSVGVAADASSVNMTATFGKTINLVVSTTNRLTANATGVAVTGVLTSTGDITSSGNVFGTNITSLTTAVTAFNGRNDRSNTAIPSVSFATDGSDIKHDVNKDGSVNISLNWQWSGSEATIDGFIVTVAPRPSGPAREFFG